MTTRAGEAELERVRATHPVEVRSITFNDGGGLTAFVERTEATATCTRASEELRRLLGAYRIPLVPELGARNLISMLIFSNSANIVWRMIVPRISSIAS